MAFFRWLYAATGPEDAESRFHPDVVLVQTQEMIGTAGEFHGYEGLAELTAELEEAFAELEWNPTEATELEDGRFLVLLEPRVVSNQGVDLSVEIAGGWLGHLITMHEDGRVLRLETYLDEAKARRAAGLG